MLTSPAIMNDQLSSFVMVVALSINKRAKAGSALTSSASYSADSPYRFVQCKSINHNTSIQICCGILYITLKTCSTMNDSNPDLVLLLSVKHLITSRISQL